MAEVVKFRIPESVKSNKPMFTYSPTDSFLLTTKIFSQKLT